MQREPQEEVEEYGLEGKEEEKENDDVKEYAGRPFKAVEFTEGTSKITEFQD